MEEICRKAPQEKTDGIMGFPVLNREVGGNCPFIWVNMAVEIDWTGTMLTGLLSW